MSQAQQRLSGFDIFGIVSGMIGLVTDAVALSAIFAVTQTQQSGATLWIVAVLSIIYTTTVVGFYARRFLVARSRQSGKDLTPADYTSIEGGATAATIVIGVPLWLAYFVIIALAFAPGEAAANSSTAAAAIVGIVFGLIPTTIVILIIHYAAKALYRAFDLEYVPLQQGD